MLNYIINGGIMELAKKNAMYIGVDRYLSEILFFGGKKRRKKQMYNLGRTFLVVTNA